MTAEKSEEGPVPLPGLHCALPMQAERPICSTVSCSSECSLNRGGKEQRFQESQHSAFLFSFLECRGPFPCPSPFLFGRR